MWPAGGGQRPLALPHQLHRLSTKLRRKRRPCSGGASFAERRRSTVLTEAVLRAGYRHPIDSESRLSGDEGPQNTAGGRSGGSYTQKLWIRVKRKAAYLPG